MNTVPGSCRMDGMLSQFAFILPAWDACVVTTGGELDMGKVYRAVFRHIPAIFEGKGSEADIPPGKIPALPEYLPLPAAQRNPALEAQLNGRCIRFVPTAQPIGRAIGMPLSMMPIFIFFMSADKAGGINKLHLRFDSENLKLSWSEGKERNTVLCGMDGRWRRCRITLGGVEFLMACCAAWEGDELNVRLRNLNSVAERQLRFRFSGRTVRMTPRSVPGLERMTGGAANAVRSSVPIEALGDFIGNMMDKITGLAEPVHVGYMK